MRYNLNGTSYKTSASDPGLTTGCPLVSSVATCIGYELTTSLDFDADGDGSSWSRATDGTLTLDAGDNNDTYFAIPSGGASGGWVPIGDCGPDKRCADREGTPADESMDNRSFNAVFDGGGHTISGLAIMRDLDFVGLFGVLDKGALITNLGLEGSLVKKTGSTTGGSVGALAGNLRDGAIVASHATGSHVEGSDGNQEDVGGLVGWQAGGTIVASYTTGVVDGLDDTSESAGGLVGSMTASNSVLLASYSTATVVNSAISTRVGGLVGQTFIGASITASYATGAVTAGGSISGGLVGQANGTVTASYATGAVAGGGSSLVGSGSTGTLSASWGFGAATGTSGNGTADRPTGITAATGITSGNVPAVWSAAASNTLNAWDFGGAADAPIIRYADYDGAAVGTSPNYTSGDDYHCANAASAPIGAILIPNCHQGLSGPVRAVGGLQARPVLGSLAAAVNLIVDLRSSPIVFPNTGGVQLTSCEVTTGTLPTGLDAEVTPDGTSCQIVGIPSAASASAAYTITATNGGGTSSATVTLAVIAVSIGDGDGDGLIDIYTPEQLNNMRYSLDGSKYKTSASDPGVTTGCPSSGCIGYELMNDLDFDLDGDGSSWTRASDGTLTLDAGDNHASYFAIPTGGASGGWMPIGDCGADAACKDAPSSPLVDETLDNVPFTAIFEGNGFAISNLATVRDISFVGLFGYMDEGAEIRNVGLVDNLAKKSGTTFVWAGGLVGRMDSGTIVASYTTGYVEGNTSATDGVGGLVGWMEGDTIAASYATGNVNGVAGTGASTDYAGGLVGTLIDGTIIASYATGSVDGATPISNNGGLVGTMEDGTIVASYATGDINSGGRRGGLVGQFGGGIIHGSYATGTVAGGTNSGSLAALSTGTITASWGFASGTAGTDSTTGSTDRPTGITAATGITSGNVPASWNAAASDTLNAWDFGGATDAPVVRYADYDGSGMDYHCANADTSAPTGATIIPNCFQGLPGQGRVVAGLPAAPVIGNIGSLTAPVNLPRGMKVIPIVFMNTGGAQLTRCEVTTGTLPTGLAVEVTPDGTGCRIVGTPSALATATAYTITATNGGGTGTATITLAVLAPAADLDGDGLIEIRTLAQLNNIRYSLDGAGYKDSDSATADTSGCPSDVCIGYELANSLDFDADGDGSSWTRDDTDGSYSLDEGDDADAYFDIASGGGSNNKTGGWVPIGTTTAPFTAILEGNGFAISNLAVLGDLTAASGLFGVTGTGAEIRNLGLVDNLVKDTGTTGVALGGLVGVQNGGVIVASYTTGTAEGGTSTTGAVTRTGGLVGFLNGGHIVGSHATGDIRSAGANNDQLGGLVGRLEGVASSIVASWASGNILDGDIAGGLVGFSTNSVGSTITASYAIGNVRGSSDTNTNRIGGLIGFLNTGALHASYATGVVTGGTANDNNVGSLVGSRSSDAVTVSWGFGATTGGVVGVGYAGTNDRPVGVTSAIDLTAANVPASWNAAASLTMGAWDYGTTVQLPALRFADYDGSGDDYHCADAASPPAGAVILACDSTMPYAMQPRVPLAPPGAVLPDKPVLANITTANLEYRTGVMADLTFTNTGGGGIPADGCTVTPNLPGSLSVGPTSDGTSCEIKGPLNETKAETTYTVTATNAGGSGSATVTFTVLEKRLFAPNLVSITGVETYTVGKRVDITFNNAGGGSLTSCTVSPALPTGLSESATDIRATCQITGIPTAVTASTEYTMTTANATAGSTATVTFAVVAAPVAVDADGDGLIEIRHPGGSCNNVRFSLDGSKYKTSATDTGNATGCPLNVCIGYELMMDLDFDTDNDGSSWTRASSGAYTLDTDDDNDAYFDVDTGGWVPIGDCGADGLCADSDGTSAVDETLDNALFTGVFEGNGNTISNLATIRGHFDIGLFGAIGTGAIVRNLHLVDNLAKGASSNATTHAGGLVGTQFGGAIIACSASGEVEAGTGPNNNVGGLVGILIDGHIVGSGATGPVRGLTHRDDVGGLVGHMQDGAITASYATGDADSGGLTISGLTGGEFAGGMVGNMDGGAITASYATGDADTSTRGGDIAGSLVGRMNAGSVTASYATGDADSGAGTGDFAGALVGFPGGGTLTASWGFGEAMSETVFPAGSRVGDTTTLDLPTGVTTAAGLTATNAPASWDQATSSTLGAWDFGTGTQTPALNFADYDGAGAVFGCGSVTGVTISFRPPAACGALIEGQGRTVTAPTLALPSLLGKGRITVPFTIGDPVVIGFANTGGGSLSRCSVSPPLPAGLSESVTTDMTSCQITGTPTAATAETTYTMTATNATGDGTATVTFTVEAPLAAPDLANLGSVPSGPVAGTFWFTFFSNTGGDELTGCSVSPPLPAGLSESVTSTKTTCQITGIAAAAAASAEYTMTATNATGSNTATVTFAVAAAPPPAVAAPDIADLGTISTGPVIGSSWEVLFINSGGGTIPDNGCTITPDLPTGLSVGPTTGGASCQISGIPTEAKVSTEYTVTATNGIGMDTATVTFTVAAPVDTDGDGLIEISTLAQLNNVRFSLDGSKYKTSASDSGATGGCPSNVCIGYELVNDLDFDGDDPDTLTWVRNNDGSYTLDTDDDVDAYFDVGTITGGWVPIGDTTTPFTGVFEGNGFAISNLLTVRDLAAVGLFGAIDTPAIVRNVHLVANLAKSTSSSTVVSSVGGLVGRQQGGAIIASSASGAAEPGTGVVNNNANDVGGLVGQMSGGHIVGSRATGPVRGLHQADRAGGLVGLMQADSTITASFATGAVTGGGSLDTVGGLVGQMQASGTDIPDIRASYATGAVSGDAGNDNAGGLVGWMIAGTITNSYATGAVDGGAGTDQVGSLAGAQITGSTVTASWGFGAKTGGETDGVDGSVASGTSTLDLPTGVTTPAGLTATNVPASWNAAASSTLGAWDFGTSTQTPALRFADYDGIALAAFHCGASTAPTGALVLPVCGRLVPGQGDRTDTLAAPALADQTSVTTYTVGSAVTILFPNSGGGELTACAVSPDLPAGLTESVTADMASCQITGTPTAAAASTEYTMTATNATGNGTATVTFIVALPAAPDIADLGTLTSGSSPVVGTSFDLFFINNSGSSLTDCSVSPSLPLGLEGRVTSSKIGCQIIGTPTAVAALTEYTMTATNAGGSDTATVTFAVTAPLALPNLADRGAIATPYPVNIAISPIVFTNSGGGSIPTGGCTVASPALPAGLSERFPPLAGPVAKSPAPPLRAPPRPCCTP